METQLQIFKNPNFGDVRTITIDKEPWFVAADVCRALELTNSRMAVERLDDDEKGVSSTDTLGGEQNMTVVNEPGSFRLDELQRIANVLNISISRLLGKVEV